MNYTILKENVTSNNKIMIITEEGGVGVIFNNGKGISMTVFQEKIKVSEDPSDPYAVFKQFATMNRSISTKETKKLFGKNNIKQVLNKLGVENGKRVFISRQISDAILSPEITEVMHTLNKK